MKNGITVYPKKSEIAKLTSQYNKLAKKKDMAEIYDTSIMNIRNVIKHGRCSEKVYKILFGN